MRVKVGVGEGVWVGVVVMGIVQRVSEVVGRGVAVAAVVQ